MIITENLTINNKAFIKTYSNSGYMVESLEDGLLYSEAFDLAKYNRLYRETTILIDGEGEEDVLS